MVIKSNHVKNSISKEFKSLNEHGTSFEISIQEIQEEVSEYSAGNGHSALRDRTRGGKQIGHLCYKYQVEKIRENDSLNSKIASLKFSKNE